MASPVQLAFPPGGPLAAHAARAWSIAADSLGGIAVAALGSGLSPGSLGGVLAYSPTTSAWYQEALESLAQYYIVDPNGIYLVDNHGNFIVSPPGIFTTSPNWPAAVANGYLLDNLLGLIAWSGGEEGFSNPPFVALASGGFGLFSISPSQVWNQDGGLVSGISTSGVFTGLGSGATTLWLLSSDVLWQATLSSDSSASTVVSATLPFTATCMAASGGILAVGGYTNNTLSSGAYAIAVAPGGVSLVTFPTAGTTQSYVLSGQPAAWTLLATTTGLPTYSSGITAAWADNGNQILLSDAVLGRWAAFSYTAGVVALLSSGALAGIGPGLAISSDSAYAIIPNPPASGFSLLVASGVGWASSGFAGPTGVAPLPAAPMLVSGDAFAVAISGEATILAYNAGVWAYQQPVPLGFTATAGAFDPTTSLAYWANPASVAATTWAGSITGVVASGGLSRPASGSASSMVVSRGQIVLAQPQSAGGQLSIVGLVTDNLLQLQTTVAVPGITVVADPLADFSIAVATSGSLSFWRFTAPYVLTQETSGVFTTVNGSMIVSPVSGLGPGYVPSALGIGAGGGMLLSTYSGGLGLLSAGPAGQVQALASGGFGAILAASGITYLPTEVQGALGWTSAF